MRSRIRQMKSVLGTILRMSCAFVLAFSGTFGVEYAFAAQNENADLTAEAADTDGTGGTTGGTGTGTDEPSTSRTYIFDVAVFDEGTSQNAYAYATSGTVREAEITSKGGSITFNAAAYWYDEGTSTTPASSDTVYEVGEPYVHWSVDDTSIASISRAGTLKANGTVDGTVNVTVTVDGAYTQDGNPISATVPVHISRQTDSSYVTKVSVCDENGAPLDTSYVFPQGTEIATAMAIFTAQVTVYDPATDSSQVYLSSPGNGLAKQTGNEISDLVWSVQDDSVGTVICDGYSDGTYRPLAYASTFVYAVSNAGPDGQQVSGQVPVMLEGDGTEGYHPQDTLTVEVYWEDYPDQIVSTKTFSVSDLEALGCTTATYTALSGDTATAGFKTYTGYGPYLSQVLTAAGANVEGVKEFRFGTYDNINRPVTYDLLFNTTCYYYPNIDINSYAGGEVVYPMVAIDSAQSPTGSSDPSSDLNEGTRFRLLFGAPSSGASTTSYQIMWINTIYVVLEGAPPVQPDNGNSDTGNGTEGTGVSGTGSDVGSGSGSGGLGIGSSQGDVGAGTVGGAGGSKSGGWSIHEMVNPNASEVDPLEEEENPLAPFVPPIAAGLVTAGCVECLARYRMQKRPPAKVDVALA